MIDKQEEQAPVDASKKSRKWLWIIVGLILLFVCAPLTFCGIGAALTPSETSTPLPAITTQGSESAGALSTASPSEIPYVTQTPSATPSKSPSPSATSSATPTLEPGTKTAEALSAAQTATSAIATATRDAYNAERTAVSANATATREMAFAWRTSTARARYSTATQIARYKPIDWRELTTYPNAHSGEYIYIKGRVFNINSNQEFQMYVGSYEAVYVVTQTTFSGLYENNWITVYGVVDGETCGTNAFGGQVCQPLIRNAFFVK